MHLLNDAYETRVGQKRRHAKISTWLNSYVIKSIYNGIKSTLKCQVHCKHWCYYIVLLTNLHSADTSACAILSTTTSKHNWKSSLISVNILDLWFQIICNSDETTPTSSIKKKKNMHITINMLRQLTERHSSTAHCTPRCRPPPITGPSAQEHNRCARRFDH